MTFETATLEPSKLYNKPAEWYFHLRNYICHIFESIENEYAAKHNLTPGKFVVKRWERGENGGYGEMSVMRGNVFEKVGVNVSEVYGTLDKDNAYSSLLTHSGELDYYATGISLVSHMQSPLVPTVHMNTRYFKTNEGEWFGGGADLTPTFPLESENKQFHAAMKLACDKFNPNFYPQFKKECDEYFYIHHRKEPRGIGGIFYDKFNTGNVEQDFAFNQEVGMAFIDVYPQIVRNKMYLTWDEAQKQAQREKLAKYAEFNLLYDRGTKFGLATGANIDALFVSLPPAASW